MDPRQSVVLATMLGFLTFWLAGDKAANQTANGIARLSGQPTTARATNTGPSLTVQRAVGWAGTFLFLVILADIPTTSEIGAALAWLLFLGIVFAFGPDAFANILRVSGQSTDTGGSGGGGGAIHHV